MANESDFALEEKLKQLTLDPSLNNESPELADIIAQCMESDSSGSAMETSESDTQNEREPTSLIVTNLPLEIFTDAELKKELQDLFHSFDPQCTFCYLRSFRRARINFSSPEIAAKARLHLHCTPLLENEIKCYFAQPPIMLGANGVPRQYLELPAPVRQFLISPPASPPVDWAPAPESGPVVNLDLLAAIASLGPGESHELLPATQEAPGIVVHICEDLETRKEKTKISRTPCPKRTV